MLSTPCPKCMRGIIWRRSASRGFKGQIEAWSTASARRFASQAAAERNAAQQQQEQQLEGISSDSRTHTHPSTSPNTDASPPSRKGLRSSIPIPLLRKSQLGPKQSTHRQLTSSQGAQSKKSEDVTLEGQKSDAPLKEVFPKEIVSHNSSPEGSRPAKWSSVPPTFTKEGHVHTPKQQLNFQLAKKKRSTEEQHNTLGSKATKRSPRSMPRSTAPDLPLSPFMIPDYFAAPNKYKQSKARPSKEPTLFQQQLARNPYAQALESACRQCAITKVYLPTFFLQDFELMRHPTTDEPWFVPRSLASKHSASLPAKPSESLADDIVSGSTESFSESKTPTESTQKETSTIGSKTYIIATQEAVGSLTGESIYRGHYTRWQSEQARYKRFPSPRYHRFRADMDTFILKLMRRRATESLQYILGRRKGYVVACKDGHPLTSVWDDVKAKKGVAAVLWVGNRLSNVDASSLPAGPPSYATLDAEKEVRSKTPVHNLQALLGSEIVEELLKKYPDMFGSGVAVLKHKNTTAELQLRLWKLQGYLYRDEHQTDMAKIREQKLKLKLAAAEALRNRKNP